MYLFHRALSLILWLFQEIYYVAAHFGYIRSICECSVGKSESRGKQDKGGALTQGLWEVLTPSWVCEYCESREEKASWAREE